MDNVLNRPLFRHREARNRLNDIAGVQRFNVGGGVFADPTGAITRPVGAGMPIIPITPVRPAGLPSALSALTGQESSDLYLRAASGMVNGARTQLEVVRRAFEEDRSPENYSRVQEAERALADAMREAENLGLQAVEMEAPPELPPALRELPPGPFMERDPSVGEGPEPTAMGLDIFGEMGRAAENAAPIPRPSGIGGARPEAPAGGMPAAQVEAPLGRSTMEADARDRGPMITNPAAVAAGLNADDPAVREKTVADFMQEYTSNAPKYEGADKNLLLAQIGFAIAAGESPNAMQNIANGLLAGSQAISQDKAAKAEFDRQLQLNALQYGLEGAESEREKGKPSLQFVATKDMTWKGRPVKEGSPVYLSYKDIADAGGVVPDGLVDAATSAALIEKTKGVTKAYQDAYDRGVIDDTELRLATEGYADQASRVAKSQRALDYFEKTLFKLGEDGNLTGIEGSFQKLIGNLGNAAGFTAKDLDVLAKAGDAAEMEELLYRGVINTVPAVVEGQSANSISDTDVRLAMKGLVDLAISQGTFSSLFTSEEKVMRQIQDSMNMIAGNRQRAFAEMSAIEARLANRYTKAGDYYNPAYATDVLRPLREASGLTEQPDMVSTYGDMVLGENGTYKLILPGG